MNQVGPSKYRNEWQRNASVVIVFMLAGTITIVLSVRVSELNIGRSMGSNRVEPWSGDVLDEDLEILRTHFPDYVLPSEREELTECLTVAIQSDDEDEALRLLEKGAPVFWMGPGDSFRSDTRAPLFQAIRRGNPRVVEAVLQRGTRGGLEPRNRIVHRRNQFGQTPLYFASRCGNREVVDLLLQYGTSINWTNGSSKTALVGAVESSDVDMFRHLLANGADCDFESAFAADRIPTDDMLHQNPAEHFVRPFDETNARTLMEIVQQSNNAELIDAVDERFRQADIPADLRAEIAVRTNDFKTLRQLIADGYDPALYHSQQDYSETLRELAAMLNHAECHEVLTEAGVVQEQVNEKASALRVIVASGDVDKIRQRLTQGATFQPHTLEQGSPLRLAVQTQQLKMVEYLLHRPEAKAWLGESELLSYSLPNMSSEPVHHRSAEICEVLINAGAAIQTKSTANPDPYNNPLLRAAWAGWPEIYTSLMDRAPGLVNHSQALQAAAYGGRNEMCRYLLALGADPNCREIPYRKSPLEYAMLHRDISLFRMLIQAGANEEYPEQFDVSRGYNNFEDYGHPLYRAALTGDAEFCRFLIEQFDTNLLWEPLKYVPYEYDNDIEYFNKGNTPLFAAVYGDHVETLQLLLSLSSREDENSYCCVNINDQNEYGETALHVAITYGADRCVQLLLASGADVTIPRLVDEQGRGQTPLHLAKRSPIAAHQSGQKQYQPKLESIVPMLIAANIRQDDGDWVNSQSGNGVTPLHAHAAAGNRRICQMLLQHRANVNAETGHGISPLANATVGQYYVRSIPKYLREHRTQLCMDLLEAGARLDTRFGRDGKSCYALAYRNGLFEFCEELARRGVEAEVLENSGDFLCSVIKHDRLDLFDGLIDSGADVNAFDSEQNTPLHIAARIHDLELSRNLIALGADPNLPDSDDETALFCVFDRFLNHTGRFASVDPEVTEARAYSVLELLLNNGANPGIKAYGGRKTVLEAFDKMPESFRTLIESHLK